MSYERAIGFLSPLVAGFYFGGLLNGAYQAARKHGRRLIAIQTLDEYAGADHPTYRHHLAWDNIDGWIVVLNAAADEHLQELARAGKPAVTLSTIIPELGCPAILPDNRHGMAEATRHLIEHGHRHIAFVGRLEQNDLRERYEGYLSALQEAGIAPDPSLFFETSDNLEYGGREAAERMRAAGIPCTAAVAATDFNAVGVMETLEHAGYRIPADLALIGFDDVKEADYTNPALSSVRQEFEDLGHRAAEVVLEMFAGKQYPAEPNYVPTTLVPRRTCGCTGTVIVDRSPVAADGETRAAQPAPAGPAAQSQLLDHMHAEDIRERLLLEVKRNAHLQDIVEHSYSITLDLLGPGSGNPTALSWLDHTHSQRGCLALWRTEAYDELEVASVYSRDRSEHPIALDARFAPARFPPLGSLPSLDQEQTLLALFPLKTRDRELGVLALDAPIDMWVSRGIGQLSQASGLISAALERDSLIRSLAEQQETLRQAYERERVLADTVRELSCPVIPLLDGVILVPIIGAIDSRRATQLLEEVLHAVNRQDASTVLLDITGVPLIDTQVANSLIQTARAAGLLGASVTLVGVRPEIAQSIVALGVDMEGIGVHQTLASALDELQRHGNSKLSLNGSLRRERKLVS